MRTRSRFLVMTATLVAAVSSSAHHSFAMFDNQQEVALAGQVRDFQWTNPHSWIFLTVNDAQGHAVEWKVEGGSPNLLQRDGWTRRSLNAGDSVTVIVHPAKDGSAFGSLVRVTLADGTRLGSR